MATLQLLSVFVILVVCWSAQHVDGQGVRFSLRGTTYQNNSLVALENIGDNDTLALLCMTDLAACCRTPHSFAIGNWFFPNGTAVPNFVFQINNQPPLTMWEFYRNRGQSVVRMIRRRGGVDGIYRCEIPVSAGPLVYQNIYIGVYATNSGLPSVTTLTFSDQSRTFICTSTGGPATTVTWRRDGVLITLNAIYQQTKTIVDPVAGTYQTVLTIDPSVGQSSIVGTYNCTVSNTRGESSKILVVTVLVSVTAGGNPTLGQSYTLTCNVSVASGVTGTPGVQWVGPGSSTPITNGGDFTVSSTPPYTLIINPLRPSHAGQYTCHATVGGDTGTASVMVENIPVPPPSVNVGFSPPGAVPYAGKNLTLSCVITLNGGITESDVMVTRRWTKDGALFSGVPGRVTLNEQRPTSSVIIRTVVFSPLSSSMDSGTYACVVTLTPIRPQFVNTVNRSQSISLAVRVPTITLALTPNTTRLPNMAPYNTFSLTCTATTSVNGRNVALPKRFLWLRRYGSSEMNLDLLSNNATIQIQDGDNLNQPTSFSMLTVTENIPRDYRYRCRVDLDLTNDMILNRMDIYPITVTGPSSPLQPSNIMSTGIIHNRATIQWTVPRIAYTPETYTVHFGTSPGALSPFNQQRQSGDNFTATNLPFSVQLTVLYAWTTYYYQVVAMNSEGSTASVEQSFTTTELPPGPPRMFQIISVTTTNIRFSWQAPAVLNGILTGYNLSCQPVLPANIPTPPILSTGSTVNTALFPNLSPGVRYNCSIVASNSAGSSNPVHAIGTTTETAPGGSPQTFTVTPGVRNMTFSWSPPGPTERNGVITGYSLSCVSEAGGGSSISMQYTAAGTFTLGGFTPATSYNCSVSASNSQGRGPAIYMLVTTLDDAMLFQLQLSGTGLRDCQEWVGIATNAKLDDITNEVVRNINLLCQCGLSAGGITEDTFQCFVNSEQQVTFRATLHGTAQVTSSQLIAYLETFVSQRDSTIAVQRLRLDVDRSCSVAISSFGDPQCARASPSLTTSMTTSDSTTTVAAQSDNTAAIVGGVVAVIVVVAVTIIIIAIAAIFVARSCGASFNVHQIAEKEQVNWSHAAKSGDEDITTTQCEAYELTKLGYEYEDLSGYQKPEYEVPITKGPAYVPTSKSGE